MIPILFEIGPIKIYSYGLMLGIAFLSGNYILAGELKKRSITPELASTITLLSVVFGLLGAKLLHLIENWNEFLADPLTAFSPGGLTWYGGFVLGMGVIIWYVRKKHIPYRRFLDALGIALILAYGIGRVGCHLAGDGDYGSPTTLPWGVLYAKGTAKPTTMLSEYFQHNPEEGARWHYDSLRVIPAGRDALGHSYNKFDETTPLHPTPLYELLLGIIGFMVLRKVAPRFTVDGQLFMLYLMLAALFRFSVEFLRLQPKILFGLSEAQLIATALFLFGAVGIGVMKKKNPTLSGA